MFLFETLLWKLAHPFAIAPSMREKDAKKKAQTHVCVNARYFLTLHYYFLFIWCENIWQNPAAGLCQWPELDADCYCVPESAGSTDSTGPAQCSVLEHTAYHSASHVVPAGFLISENSQEAYICFSLQY